MATAMLNDRVMRRKIVHEEITDLTPKPVKKPPKRKATQKAKSEQNNNIKRQRISVDNKDDMLANYQPWVIQTYGDLAKTKTITLKKYARILRTLRGDEVVSADNSKFRFWVKAKGFCVGKPAGYEAKPADAIVGRYSVCDMDMGIPAANDKMTGSAKDPPLYVPNAPFKNSTGEPVYRKVAVVENFFDIIYNVHVELEGRPGKHAGQKRTYRTITETYAFLPREAVTRFLLGCTECQKHPRSPSPISVLPTPSPSPTLPPVVPAAHTPLPPTAVPAPALPQEIQETKAASNGDSGADIAQSQAIIEGPLRTSTPEPKRSSNPLDVCNLTSRDPPKKSQTISTQPKLWSPVEAIEREEQKKKMMMVAGNIDYSLPITTTYLKYMRSLGCTDEDALKLENKHVSYLIERLMHELISDYFY